MEKSIALIDADAFYVSCERVYDPTLEGKPVIVLSNNDANAIARNAAAKALGIEMGDPWFKIKHLEQSHGLIARSSNYPLYAHVSNRFMATLSEFSPHQEIYSIDESFLDLTGMPGRKVALGLAIRHKVKKEVGLTVGIGIGRTKTLAKLANRIAKKFPEFEGVVDLNSWAPHNIVLMLSKLSVRDVWGVGERFETRFIEMGIKSAMDLKLADPEYIRQQFGVVGSRIVRELNGQACLELEDVRPIKQQIMSSRSFGRPVTDINGLSEALASFIHRGAEKLRLQDSYAGALTVHISTSQYAEGPRYGKSGTVQIPIPTNDTCRLNVLAQAILQKIYKPNFRYTRAGIMLDNIVPASATQVDMLGIEEAEKRNSKLMQALDTINAKMGRNTVRFGTVRNDRPWAMKQERLSPSYTSNINDVPRAS